MRTTSRPIRSNSTFSELMPLFLVGYMGCGKTSLGRRLARRLGWGFVDTDALVEQAEGASVTDIFRYAGEEYFRLQERAAVERLLAEGGQRVVSTGGGLPCWRDNMERLNGAGTTVYIRRTAEQIVARLSPYGRQKRPRLRGLGDEELLAYMIRNMAEREPFYLQAHHMLDGGHLSDERIVDALVKMQHSQ